MSLPQLHDVPQKSINQIATSSFCLNKNDHNSNPTCRHSYCNIIHKAPIPVRPRKKATSEPHQGSITAPIDIIDESEGSLPLSHCVCAQCARKKKKHKSAPVLLYAIMRLHHITEVESCSSGYWSRAARGERKTRGSRSLSFGWCTGINRLAAAAPRACVHTRGGERARAARYRFAKYSIRRCRESRAVPRGKNWAGDGAG